MNDFIWAEKYRPKTIRECILPKKLKDTFQDFVNKDNIPNLILSGQSGCGKTTVAKAMLNELDVDFIVINGSLNGNIDTLRNEIMKFASTVSFTNKRKYIILDEGDFINPQSTQPSLRNFMEEYSSNCGFIFTCNYLNKIIPALQSRCSVIRFDIDSKEKPKLASDFFNRVCEILEKENVKFNKKVVAELIQIYFPDWRRTLNELQRNSSSGIIDESILVSQNEFNISELIDYLKNKDFKSMRRWISENSDIETSGFYRILCDHVLKNVGSASAAAQAIVTIAEYEYKEAFVANRDINRSAACTTLLIECDWK